MVIIIILPHTTYIHACSQLAIRIYFIDDVIFCAKKYLKVKVTVDWPAVFLAVKEQCSVLEGMLAGTAIVF